MFLDRGRSLANLNVAVEQYVDCREIAAGLESRGSSIVEVPVFGRQLKDTPVPADLDEVVALLKSGELALIYLESPEEAFGFLRACGGESARTVMRWLANTVVIVGSGETESYLRQQKLRGQFLVMDGEGAEGGELGRSKSTSWRDSIEEIYERGVCKRQVDFPGEAPWVSDDLVSGEWDSGPFMKACRGEETEVTPIWMMRQAGRYLKEYRDVRSKVSFLDLCASPQLCSEVACTAAEKLGVDAAIVFSDLLAILVPLGCDLEFVKGGGPGGGPVIHNPIRQATDVDRVVPLESLDELSFVMEAVRQTREDLPGDLPLIGFAGAPFTLASYMIEGGASRHYENTKRLMVSDSGAWHELMQRLTDSVALYLNGQVAAGAQCLQLFDSWAGCLGFEDYRVFVLPYVKQIIDRVPPHIPVINFATGNPALLPLLADTQASVIGVDWRIRLDDAWQTVGYDRSVQGNLDPTLLLTDPETIHEAAKVVLDQAAGRKGHIFNLGHGILPTTPVENAIALVDAVHELSRKGADGS